MKFFLYTLFLIIGTSCIQSTGKRILPTRLLASDTSVLSLKFLKRNNNSSDSIYYIYKNGVLIKSVIIDSVVNKARVVNALVINRKFYLVYARFTFQYPLIEDISCYYKGHFLNSYDPDNLPANIGDIFNAEKLVSKDTEIDLGFACSQDDVVEIKKVTLLHETDSSFFIIASVPRNSDVFNHVLVKKQNKQFYKLLNIESTDPKLKFQVQSDSIISFHKRLITTDIHEDGDYIFNLNTNSLIKK